MSERHFYQAGRLLATALRGYSASFGLFTETVVKPWMAEHPGSDPVLNLIGQQVIGFKDEAAGKLPPAGLSRNSRRDFLIPVRGAAGQPWRDAMAKFNKAPKLRDILRFFEIPSEILTGGGLYVVNWMDFLPDVSDVVVLYVMGELPENKHLTPMKTSEFFVLYEKAREIKNERAQTPPPGERD
jgi:hypothetical protein